ncbi:sugar ABC transporter ATP-binding protein [Paenibacillus brasilensis]|uniref:Simple sugar transport system ATP-binding protein n=1 Tax=Paenibacillus brasilensis TaxID=128574 RepID=A0ABU0KUV9_9BACL|nr:sugar ABC transporter ATP-binding protein [Paenibacillus brasilensis]MDQ0492023.1 simple sugar transport system ATP-binding protein [Paenibacillus brasilensis]
MSSQAYTLEMRKISKRFAGVDALRAVDFTVHGGEIHALLGANGAGKSTLMKILSGAYRSDQGAIVAGGEELSISSPWEAKRAGIHCVYQEVDSALVPQLSVGENIILDDLSAPEGRWWAMPGSMRRRAREALVRLGADIDVRQYVSELTLAEKQLVLIARILTQQAKTIIFDEPTAPLSEEETRRLFRTIHTLKDEGVACILITHRLPEVIEHSDRVTVMRDGERVFTGPASDLSVGDIVTYMLGKTFEEEFPKTEVPIGEAILEARGLRKGLRVHGVDLQVRRGEVLSIVGLVGAGKTELSRLLTGADKPDRGELVFKGRSIRLREPADAVVQGIVSIPEERRKQGVLIEENVERNLSLPLLGQLSVLGFISRPKERANGNKVVASLGIKTSSLRQNVKYLSGGNQQKVAIGKWLHSGADVFVFDEPTKGVDIGAKSDIFRIIGELAAQGKAIIYLTCEFAEGIGIGDRIAVMYDGKIIKEFARGEVEQEQLLLYASGGEEVHS